MRKTLRTLTVSLLSAALLAGSVAHTSASPLVMGDINGDGSIDASDALIALQHSVRLRFLNEAELSMADVTADNEIDAQDALNILQHSVGLIQGFANQGDGKINWKLYYGLDGKDLDTMASIQDINDSAEVLDKLNQAPQASDTAMYENDDFGNLIYNPISREAAKTGQLTKYNAVQTNSGSVSIDGVTVKYSIPKNATAYDAVPIRYSASDYADHFPLYIEATAYGEDDRDGDYYDMTLPGKIDADIVFDGYVSGTLKEEDKPVLSGKGDDKQGVRYPAYDASNLVRSGTLPVADLIWLKFTYTNTGDTIWDPDGNGNFAFQPVLYKKDSKGEWTTNDKFITVNHYERIFDYVYPGESGEMYVQFQQQGLSSGEYRVVIYGKADYESTSNDWTHSWNNGSQVTASSFEFTVSKNAGITEPKPVEKQNLSRPNRAGWLRTYEEFMTSFEAIIDSDGYNGTMYLQCAPWTEYVTLRFMTGNEDNLQVVRVPINIESDSIQIPLNKENQNYIVKEDGTREPMVMTQSMADMRANIQRGPDPASTIVNDLKDMKEAGINCLSSTLCFTYEMPITGSNFPLAYETNRFLLDAARALGLQSEAYCCYPYEWAGLYSPNVSNITAPIRGFANPQINTANAVLANFTFQRYADILYQAADGTIPVATEDTRGWLRADLSGIFDYNDTIHQNFIEWLKGKYPTIEALNAAYGSNYASFESIDIVSEASATGGHAGYSDHMLTFFNSSSTFHDWSRAMLDLDIFRTVQRARDYTDMIEKIPTTTPPKNTTDTVINPKVLLRTEYSPYVSPGINPSTDNAHYRMVYYAQRRNAVVGEILAASGAVQGHSEYIVIPFTPSEVYELVSRSTEAGIVEYSMPLFSGLSDIAFNDTHGQDKYVQDLNLANESGNIKGAYIHTMSALFPWFKATYEGGGVPGLLWQDYLSSTICTSTQFKELKFYHKKIQEMLSTDEGRAWATNFTQPDQSWRETTATAWSYPSEYIRQTIDSVERKCVFEGLYR